MASPLDDPPLYLGIDVGTGSARAAFFTDYGGQVGQAGVSRIKTFRPVGYPQLFQQSTEIIWRAVCSAVHTALNSVVKIYSGESSGVEAPREALFKVQKRVVGLAFDATCSLVVRGKGDQPIDVTPKNARTRVEMGQGPAQEELGGREGREEVPDVVLWLDHRASREAAEINAMAQMDGNGANQEENVIAQRLRHVGGKISPENQVPKLLWLKRHLEARIWGEKEGGQEGEMPCEASFYDLTDYLSHRACRRDGEEGQHGNLRSLCCVGSKWLYRHDGHEEAEADVGGWSVWRKDKGWKALEGSGRFWKDKEARAGEEYLGCRPRSRANRGHPIKFACSHHERHTMTERILQQSRFSPSHPSFPSPYRRLPLNLFPAPFPGQGPPVLGARRPR